MNNIAVDPRLHYFLMGAIGLLLVYLPLLWTIIRGALWLAKGIKDGDFPLQSIKRWKMVMIGTAALTFGFLFSMGFCGFICLGHYPGAGPERYLLLVLWGAFAGGLFLLVIHVFCEVMREFV